MNVRVRHLANKHRSFLLYGVIGASGATLDLVFYVVFYHFMHIYPPVASFLSVSIGIANNFILNLRHNFKVSDKLMRRFASFYTIGLAGAVLSSLLIALLYDMLGVQAFLAKIITIPPVVILQFFLNKHLSFSGKTLFDLDTYRQKRRNLEDTDSVAE